MTGRIFSGVQPTGHLHLGNYLGAIRTFADLQKGEKTCIYCIVDLHAITLWQDPRELRQNILAVAAGFLAAGIDPGRSLIFVQSAVSAHAELAWILGCVARLGWLNRMTQFKEKSGKKRENAPVGLYVYPCLMAADILAYNADCVPVGEDQQQHLELARDIARKFNLDCGRELFVLPEPLVMERAARVMSLRDGTRKMSKSDSSDQARINLTDGPDVIAGKIRRARTDSDPLPETPDGLAGRPEAENLVTIHAALSGRSIESIVTEFAGQGFARLKASLTEELIETIVPIGKEMQRLAADQATLLAILEQHAERAARISAPVMREVREAVGLWNGRLPAAGGQGRS